MMLSHSSAAERATKATKPIVDVGVGNAPGRHGGDKVFYFVQVDFAGACCLPRHVPPPRDGAQCPERLTPRYRSNTSEFEASASRVP